MEYIKKISPQEIAILERHKNLPLMNDNKLCYIIDYEVVEKEIDYLLYKTKVQYLTKYKVSYYNALEKKVFIADDNSAIKWLPITTIEYQHSPTKHGISKCRENYLTFKETFEGFGHKMISDLELKEIEKENN